MGAGPVYLALGDSMSIDDYAGGPGRGAASLLARNRDGDFPSWRGRDLATRWPRSRLLLLAKDGATSASVLEGQLPRLARVGTVPALATLTVGGNDLLLAYGDTAAARAVRGRLAEHGDAILAELRRVMGPAAPIVVATVYDPSDGTGDAAALGLPPWPDALELLGECNATLEALAVGHGALVADVHRRFGGHGLTAGDPAQPHARPPSRDLWYCGVIEPNAWGASEIRAAFWEALEGGGLV